MGTDIPGPPAIDVFGLDGNSEAIAADTEFTIGAASAPVESCKELISDENQVVVVSFGDWIVNAGVAAVLRSWESWKKHWGCCPKLSLIGMTFIPSGAGTLTRAESRVSALRVMKSDF